MKKICVILVYFGPFPNYFNLWLKSCAYNPTIDFLIVTDQTLTSVSKNIRVVNMSRLDLEKLAQERIDNKVRLASPYKCCDFKPAYGLIFGSYLKDYDFWGYCDCDLIFGDLRQFLPDSILDSYDKLYALGHLSLYRNDAKINNAFKLPGSKWGDYSRVLTRDKSFYFDEIYGIYRIFTANHLSMYCPNDYADINFYKQFKLTRSIVPGCTNRENYQEQVFYWEKGHVYRAYVQNGVLLQDEFIYVHFQKRKHLQNPSTIKDSFFIGPRGFSPKTQAVTQADMELYNPHDGKYSELGQWYWFKLTNLLSMVILKVRSLL